MDFSYVYILQSQSDVKRFYSGLTDNLKDRLRRHNAGEVAHTSKFRPWRVKTAIAFTDRNQASGFERYLKTASGRTFTNKPFSALFRSQRERRLPRRSLLLRRRRA